MLNALYSTLHTCTTSHISRLLWISHTCKILVSSMVMTRELPERKEPGPRGFKMVLEEEVMKGSKGREEFNQRPQPVAQRKQRVNKIKTR